MEEPKAGPQGSRPLSPGPSCPPEEGGRTSVFGAESLATLGSGTTAPPFPSQPQANMDAALAQHLPSPLAAPTRSPPTPFLAWAPFLDCGSPVFQEGRHGRSLWEDCTL